MKVHNSRVWICEDCMVVFQVHMKLKPNFRPFCPTCADNVEVRKYESDRQFDQNKGKYVIYTPEELEILQQVVDGKLLPYQAAAKIGRSINAITKKAKRMKEEQSDRRSRKRCSNGS